MRISTLLPILFLVSCFDAKADFDEKYRAYSGDLNGDGNADLFVSREPDLVLLHGEIITPIVTVHADYLVLIQNPDQTFTVDDTLTPAELASLKTWPASPVNLNYRDMNVDGQIDLFIEGFVLDASFDAGINDHILFASDTSSPHIREVDAEFRQFSEEVFGSILYRNYFEAVAINNGWFHYEGELKTGWWVISYINLYYSYNNGNSTFLDEDDDPNDPNNEPAYCVDNPAYCRFDFGAGVWAVFGTYLDNIEIVYDYSNFNQDALAFATAADYAVRDPVNATNADASTAEAILESKLGVQVGETIAGILADRSPAPQLPDGTQPQPRQLPKPLPDAANDPDFGRKHIWKILGKINIVICGLLFCSNPGDPDEVEKIEWELFGWEWAADDLLENDIDNSVQVNVVIGEGEGGNVYNRIPNAALTYSAIYYNPGRFTSGEPTGRTAMFMWYMNYGWVNFMIDRQALFYDIGLYGPRQIRGEFYPCERNVLESYPLRQEVPGEGTAGYSYGSCNLWNIPN